MRQQLPRWKRRGLKTTLQHASVAAPGTAHPTHQPRDLAFFFFFLTSLPWKKKERERDSTSQKPLVTHAAAVLRRRRQGQTDTSVTWTAAGQSGLNLIFFLSPPPSGAVVRSDRSKMATVEPVSTAFGPHPHRPPRSGSLRAGGPRGTAFLARTLPLAAPSPSSWA